MRRSSGSATGSGRGGALTLLLTAGCAALESPDEAPTAAAESYEVHGRVSARYRARKSDSERDHDGILNLRVDGGDPANDAWTWHTNVHLAADLDGATGADRMVFGELSDTYDDKLTGRVIHAWVDVHAVEELDTLRVGRQLLYDTPETVYFDGVHAAGEGLVGDDVTVGAFTGVAARPYESNRDGDFLAGVYTIARPHRTLHARLDWLHLEDDLVTRDAEDDLLAGRLAWTPSPRWRVEAAHSRIEADPRDVRLAASLFDAEADLTLHAAWYELLETQRDLVVPLDPFFTTLFEYFPFRLITVLASKGIGDVATLQSGIDVRRVEDEANLGTFNHDYERIWFSGTSDRVLPGEVVTTITGESWVGDGDRIESWGVDLSREFGAAWRASTGSYFSLYRYDFFAAVERDRVRVWYANLRYRVADDLTLRLRYELQDDELNTIHTLRLETTWVF